MNYWLLKTEPESYSIDDLDAAPDRTTCWDGVRNYQARNFMRDSMRVGDRALLYHSSTKPPAVVGIVEIVKEGYPDPTAWDSKSDYIDPQSTPDEPRWYMVDVQLVEIFSRAIPLDELREVPALAEMELLRKGSRLSVQPVRPAEFKAITRLARPDTKRPRSKP